jgi:hypothetical protein
MNSPVSSINIKRLIINVRQPLPRSNLIGSFLSNDALAGIIKAQHAAANEVPDGLLFDPDTGLYRANNPFGDKKFNWNEAKKACRDLKQIEGFTPFRAATLKELFAMVDITRHHPAVDPDKYPDIKSAWYWSSDYDAESPSDDAWGVGFVGGGALRYYQGYGGRVVPVCSRVSSQ